MAANLNVFNSVTHAPTFSDYALLKEMNHAFDKIPAAFRSAARLNKISAGSHGDPTAQWDPTTQWDPTASRLSGDGPHGDPTPRGTPRLHPRVLSRPHPQSLHPCPVALAL